MSAPDPTAADVVRRLVAAGATLATAESLTGGLVGAALTDVPGSSAAYVGGVVSYATDVKTGVLGVPADVVERDGVVSATCAEAMAVGARRLLGSAYAVSTTGVAGPDLQEGRPAGTAYVAVAGPRGTVVRELAVPGDRGAVRAGVVREALALVVRTVVADSAEHRPGS